MLYAGTSGYSFKEWVGSFYPAKTPGGKYLAYYASRLKTVEINHTFRRFPTMKLISSWAAQTSASFKFSMKMHQGITHLARLKEVSGPVQDFLRALEPLGPRLGVVLFQLPPYLPADLDRLKKLLAELPRDRKFAFEFRHPSWNSPDTADLLRKFGVALCAAEVQIGDLLPAPTAAHGYMRLRKVPPFSAKELAIIRGQMRSFLERVDDLYVYIKHDEAGLAPQIALDLQSS